ncbi:Lysine-specific histone demethylase 1-like protein [Thalictrum thalictroides]|uniref:Lysine-specific histone demethylase 1-like protein n=1 Tax=Thalictrum thalictroides TaxID=46969 RepID=A0A7J6V3H8_THATH|nr:Lysine-specific histone demethylase 1-like protein [Thalictrum thalictroides]
MESSSSGCANGSRLKRSLRKNIGVRNYDENLMDELIEKHLGNTPRKKNKTIEDMEKETETEAMIALSLGFPIDELLEEEVKHRVVSELGGKQQNDYIVVRNHILAKWRNNVRTWISKDQIKETVSNEYGNLINSAYDFLLSHGYINFGVLHSGLVVSSHLPEGKEGSVIIVGSGLAGLAAARQLLSFGFKVVVLEGRNRPGGRVYTQRMGREGNFVAVDLGGSVLTGIHANPLGVLARQLSIPLHKVRDKCPLYKPDGAPINEEIDSKVDLIFNKLLDKATEFRKLMGESANDISLGLALETFRRLYGVLHSTEEVQLLDWHLANLEYANAGCLLDLSVAYWDQDDPYEMGGDHCFLAGGNWRLIKAMCEEVPIFYGKPVNYIKHGNEGVEVVSGDQVFRADMVLCTVPLGVLKNRMIKFEPELPKRKLGAIERLGFGLLNKVAMVFPHVFWGEDIDTFGCLNQDTHRRGEFFLFYSYHTVSGGPVLIALIAGEAALTSECTDSVSLLHCVLSVLRGIFSPKGIEVPNPIQTICTKWGSDPLCHGSYSHIRVGSSGIDYDILAESVGGRLFFAGEATSRQYPATMHGAFLSGLREASHMLHTIRTSHDGHMKWVSKNIGPCSDLLIELFKEPDLVFGKFAFVFDPSKKDPESMGLMKVTFKNPNNDFNDSCEKEAKNSGDNSLQLPLPLYTVLSREQAYKIQYVDGDDGSKLSILYKNLGLALAGPGGLGSLGHSLIVSIASARRVCGRHQFAVGRPKAV